MDTAAPADAKHGKYYMLTDEGLSYIEHYIPKEESDEKKKPRARKTTVKKTSAYSSINADDLNLSKYPAVKTLPGAKERVIMAMYIVTSEGKGEWFTVEDVIYLLVNIFEVSASSDYVNNVFKRNKSLFHSEPDENNKKALRRKILSGAKDYAVSLIPGKN